MKEKIVYVLKIATFFLFAAGMILILGTVGAVDQDRIELSAAVVRCCIGGAMMIPFVCVAAR